MPYLHHRPALTASGQRQKIIMHAASECIDRDTTPAAVSGMEAVARMTCGQFKPHQPSACLTQGVFFFKAGAP
jgi:hypothetical protein